MKILLWSVIYIVLIVSLFRFCTAEYKDPWATFIHGSITDDGNYDFEDTKSIVTKNAIKCTKFRIQRDFDADYEVKIYFYNDKDEFLEKRELTGNEYEITYATMPRSATHIRIVLTSPVTGFSDWDCFRFKWFDSGLKVSKKKKVQSVFGSFFSSGKLDDVLGDIFNPGKNSNSTNNDSGTGGQWLNDQPISFSYGEINPSGILTTDSKKAIYTAELISCTGYRLAFDYGSDYLCMVHYYTADNRWISSQSVNPGDILTVKDGEMPFITADDGTKLSAAGIRICLVKVPSDLLNGTANIDFWDKQNADGYLTLDIYLPSAAPAVLQFPLPAAPIGAAAAE